MVGVVRDVEVWRCGGVEVVVEAAGVKVQAKSAAW